MTTNKSNYSNLKDKEKELLAQLKRVQDELKVAENEVIEDKLNTAIQCLVDVDEMTHGYYRCSIETYCENCDATICEDVDLSEIIRSLQRLR